VKQKNKGDPTPMKGDPKGRAKKNHLRFKQKYDFYAH
jgi:hypothetical protein